MTFTAFLILALLGVKHFIADFVLQNSDMVLEKGIYGAKGGIDHASYHGLGTVWMLVWFVSLPTAIVIGIVDMVVHYHIDWTKQQLNRGLGAQDQMFWFYLGLDQGLHYLTYIAIVAWINI